MMIKLTIFGMKLGHLLVIHASLDVRVIELVPVSCFGKKKAWECCHRAQIKSMDDERGYICDYANREHCCDLVTGKVSHVVGSLENIKAG